MNTILHFIIYTKIIVLVTSNTALTTTKSGRLGYTQTRHPQEYIDVVYMLFYNVVTRQPFPVHPVTDHPFHITPTLFTVSIPKHRLVPIYITTSDFTYITSLNQLISFYIRTLMMTLSTCNNTQILSLCLLGSCHNGTIAFCIDCNRFFQERMLTFLSRILEVKRTEYRRSGQNYHVYTRVNDLLVSIESDKAIFSRYFLIVLSLQIITKSFQTIGKNITQSMYFNTTRSIQQIFHCATTTATTSNDTNLQLLAINRLIRQFRHIKFPRLFQWNQFVTTFTC